MASTENVGIKLGGQAELTKPDKAQENTKADQENKARDAKAEESKAEDEGAETRSEEQKAADEEYVATQPAHPVIRAAERKRAEVEAGRYMDVQRHEELRLEAQGLSEEDAAREAAGGRHGRGGLSNG